MFCFLLKTFIVELSSECWFFPFLLSSIKALGMKLLLKYDNPRENVRNWPGF